MRKTKAFTLIELLVVVAIIALLLAVITPSLRTAKELSRRIVCGSNMRSQALAAFVYADEEADRLPPLANSKTRVQYRYQNLDARYWYISNSATDSTVSAEIGDFYNLGVLWQTGRIDVGKLFYCTSMNIQQDFRYNDYETPVFPTAKKPSVGSGAMSVRCSYSYNPECPGNATKEDRVMLYTRKTKMPSTAVFLADNINAAGPPHAGGWNVAYGDGSVSYFKDPELEQLIKNFPVDFNGYSRDAYIAWDQIIRSMKGRQ